MTMYYDRRLPERLVQLLAPGQALHWMVTLVRSPDQHLTHVQFRRANGTRSRGGIQVYLGRTSPLEVVGCPGDRVQCRADRFYRGLAPELFDRRFDINGLTGLSAALDLHVRVAAGRTHRSFLDGEAIPHAGMLRRYGHGYRAGDPLLAVDSEVRVGFGSMAERATFEDDLRGRLGLKKKDLPRKLDTIGVLFDGNIGLVELKEQRGDMARAAIQAAAHVHTFGHLVKQRGYDMADVLGGMTKQKLSVGLLPTLLAMNSEAKLVPIIAAPDGRQGWRDIWTKETQAVRAAQPQLLAGLRFWRLSPTGEVMEEHRP